MKYFTPGELEACRTRVQMSFRFKTCKHRSRVLGVWHRQQWPAATLSSESAAPASHGRQNTGLAVVPDSISITQCRCVGENLAAASETASSAQAGGGAFY